MGYIPSWRDIVLPFSLAIFEFLLFTVLQEQNPQGVLWHYWLLVFAGFTFNSALIVWNVLSKMNTADFDDKLHNLINNYKKWMTRDCLSAGAVAVISLFAWIILNYLLPPEFQSWLWVFGIIAFFPVTKAIYDQEKDRKRIVKFLFDQAGE